MSYIIVDLDGTLILENEQPNQPLIDALNEEVMSGDAQIIVVSARKVDRLQETRAWLQENKVAGVEEVHLNDFEGSAFATGFAFKEYKYGLLKEQYGEELEYAIDNDPAVREMARGLVLDAVPQHQGFQLASTVHRRGGAPGRHAGGRRILGSARGRQRPCYGAHAQGHRRATACDRSMAGGRTKELLILLEVSGYPVSSDYGLRIRA